MQKQWDEQKHQNFSESYKAANLISDVTNINQSFPVQNNFETFNNEQKESNVKIVDWKHQNLLVQDLFDAGNDKLNLVIFARFLIDIWN